MTRRIDFRVTGFRAVHMFATGTVLEALDSVDGSLWDAEMYLSTDGIELNIPKLGKSPRYLPAGGHWPTAFLAVCPPDSASLRAPVTGMLAASIIRKLRDWQQPARASGERRERGELWKADREEFFAAVVLATNPEQPGRAAKVTNAIAAAAAAEPALFQRVFNGKYDAARRDYYRRAKEFEVAPAGSPLLGRIEGMTFEFEDDPTE